MSREQLDQLIESALRFKSGDDASKPLAGKSVALVFFNPSLRTRASMQVGIYELGGNAVCSSRAERVGRWNIAKAW